MNIWKPIVIVCLVALVAALYALPETTDIKVPEHYHELVAYLKSKNSPLPANILIQHDNWPLMVALSGAESQFGVNGCGGYQEYHNAWGIMWQGECATWHTWEWSIPYVSKLLHDRYEGMTVEQMAYVYKGVPPYEHWIYNVSWFLKEIEYEVTNN
jgi:hypothetical protein